MDELIEQLKNEAGLNKKQALAAIRIVKDYAKSKFPMFGGAIEKVFSKYAAPHQNDEDDFLDS